MSFRGHVDGLSRYAVEGWAADDDQPERPVAVSILVNGKQVAQIIADQPREDLRRLGDFGSGKHGFSYAFSPSLPATEQCEVSVVYSETTETVPNGVSILHAKEPEIIAPEIIKTSLEGLLVTSHARSGSTILMKRLSEHPQIAIANLHPFEIKLLSYYSSVYRILTARGDRVNSSTPESLERDQFYVGYNPYFDVVCLRAFADPDTMYSYFEGTSAIALREVFRRIVEGYYKIIEADQVKLNCKYFAEKNDIFGRTRTISRELFPNMKEIILVRDLRDVLCSSRAFFKSEEISVDSLRDCAKMILSIYKSSNNEILFVRYEDLIRNDRKALTRVARYLEIDTFPAIDEADAAATFEGHGTSTSPLSSIGRWHDDLTIGEKQMFADEFSDFFSTFGYDPE